MSDSKNPKTLPNPLIVEGALDTEAILRGWENEARVRNFGALCVFIGIVRAEDGIAALSFDIYLPLLELWLQSWQNKARAVDENLRIFMAHASGDVVVGESSFACAIASKNRRAALEIYGDFIEDFKANAPIWKYDVKNGARIYAQDRSKKLRGAGILAE